MLIAAVFALALSGAGLSADGFGPVKVGMTLQQVEAATGQTLQLDEVFEGESCREATFTDGPEGLWLMVEDGRVSRISMGEGSGDLATDRGVGVGDDEAAVLAAYPGAEVEPHEYLGEPAHYLTWWAKKDLRGLRFETDEQGKVTVIHGGSSSITFIEGCA